MFIRFRFFVLLLIFGILVSYHLPNVQAGTASELAAEAGDDVETAVFTPIQNITQQDDDPLPDPGKPPLTEGSPVDTPLITSGDNNSLDVHPNAVSVVPTITAWYENDLGFGQRGNPQTWVNILGNASDNVTSLRYKLNGGSFHTLSFGPDQRRLASDGDFNIELDHGALNNGSNTVYIEATNASGTSNKTVDFNYAAGNIWPSSYTADWSAASSIHDVAQVVDGEWTIEAGGTLRPLDVATGATPVLNYDRLVAIGDMSWENYEVTVPLTIHGIDEDGFAFPSGGPGVGIILRWNEHYQEGSEQPRIGWRRLGALGWYRWAGDPANPTAGLQMIGFSDGSYPAGGNILDENASMTPPTEVEQIMKMNVRTTADGAIYRLRVWNAADAEPDTWDMVGTLSDVDDPGHPATGSMLLVAHHVDVSFGNVAVEPLSDVRQTLSVSTSGNGSVDIDPSGQSDYEFGSEVTLTAVPQTGYQFDGWTGDLTGSANPATIVMDADKSVTATFKAVEAPYSDNFNSCTLDPMWTFVDPLGDSSYVVKGEQIELTVPAGTGHDLWHTTNQNAIRLMQSAVNDDFTLEVKFENGVSGANQLQGIIVQQDANDFIRFDFFSDSNNAYAFAARFTNGTAAQKLNEVVPYTGTSDWRLRVVRNGNNWSLFYKVDGMADWNEADSGFTESLTVSSVGVFAGSADSNPGHTAVIDYFHNNAAPSLDDPLSATVDTNVTGQGSIQIAPADYGCGDTLTFTADAQPGHQFTTWSGDLSGSANPKTLPFSLGLSVGATFKEEFTLTVNTVGDGTVDIETEKAVYLDGEEVTLTAVPADGWLFKAWSGGAAGSTSPLTVTMNSDKTITAIFVEGYEIYLPLIVGNP